MDHPARSAMPFHLWFPRALVWGAALAVAVLAVTWYVSPESNDILGIIGGLWAIARVTQFLFVQISGALGRPK